MGEYMNAAVCRRGHSNSSDLRLKEPAPRCAECGAKVLTQCESCSGRIRGRCQSPGVIATKPYSPPDFCDLCGSPHPWASRQARIYELENILDEQDLDPADRLFIHEQLDVLRQPDVSEEEQRERWARIKKIAPGFVEAGGRIIESVVSATIKAQLGL